MCPPNLAVVQRIKKEIPRVCSKNISHMNRWGKLKKIFFTFWPRVKYTLWDKEYCSVTPLLIILLLVLTLSMEQGNLDKAMGSETRQLGFKFQLDGFTRFLNFSDIYYNSTEQL